MCTIIQDPQLRFTPDETPVAEMLVEFAAIRAEDSPHHLKVVAWGNLGEDVARSYHQGDRVIIQGSLRMNSVDRPEGFKEKRAELTVSRIYSMDGEPVATQPLVRSTPSVSASNNGTTPSTPPPSYEPVSSESTRESLTPSTATASPPSTPQPIAQPLEEDEIPF